MAGVKIKGLSAAADQLPLPLYEYIKRQLAEAIVMGTYPPGAALPGEVALARRFGVSVGTMRRALAELTAEGMLTRRRKTGTVVTGRSPHHTLRNFFAYFRLHGADGSLLSSTPQVLSLARDVAAASEATAFNMAAGDEVIRIHRVRTVRGKPVMHAAMVMPAARLADFPDRLSQVPDLLYLYLLDRHGIRISAVRESVTAAVATADDRRILALPRPAAVLVIDEAAYDQSGAAIILSHHRATTEGYCYLNEVR